MVDAIRSLVCLAIIRIHQEHIGKAFRGRGPIAKGGCRFGQVVMGLGPLGRKSL